MYILQKHRLNIQIHTNRQLYKHEYTIKSRWEIHNLKLNHGHNIETEGSIPKKSPESKKQQILADAKSK
jgi:hypothetical protein